MCNGQLALLWVFCRRITNCKWIQPAKIELLLLYFLGRTVSTRKDVVYNLSIVMDLVLDSKKSNEVDKLNSDKV